VCSTRGNHYSNCDDICDDARSRVKGDSGPNFLVVSFRDTVAEPLLLGGSRRGAEADRHPVVGVHQTNRNREVGELLPVEHRGGGFIFGIGHACFGDARHRLRPGKRRTLGLVEQRTALAPGPEPARASRL
jgi:hypothetical protein